MKADNVHKDSRTLQEEPQVFTRWIDSTIDELKKQLEESDFKIANLTMDKIELKKQLEDLQETHYLIQGGRSNGKTYLMKLQADKEQLNSLVNSCQEEIRRLKKQLEEKENIACDWKDSCLENAGKIEILENQQKEFIEYITSYIELLSNKPDLIEESEIDLLKEILSKYKETIGVSDEN